MKYILTLIFCFLYIISDSTIRDHKLEKLNKDLELIRNTHDWVKDKKTKKIMKQREAKKLSEIFQRLNG